MTHTQKSGGGGASLPNSLTDALATLEQHEHQLVAQLEVVRRAKAAITDLLTDSAQVPPAATPPAPRTTSRKAAASRVTRASGPSDDDVRRVLKRGPISPAQFSQALRLERLKGRQLVAALEARGMVRVTGVTKGRRIALAGTPTAKEGP